MLKDIIQIYDTYRFYPNLTMPLSAVQKVIDLEKLASWTDEEREKALDAAKSHPNNAFYYVKAFTFLCSASPLKDKGFLGIYSDFMNTSVSRKMFSLIDVLASYLMSEGSSPEILSVDPYIEQLSYQLLLRAALNGCSEASAKLKSFILLKYNKGISDPSDGTLYDPIGMLHAMDLSLPKNASAFRYFYHYYAQYENGLERDSVEASFWLQYEAAPFLCSGKDKESEKKFKECVLAAKEMAESGKFSMAMRYYFRAGVNAPNLVTKVIYFNQALEFAKLVSVFSAMRILREMDHSLECEYSYFHSHVRDTEKRDFTVGEIQLLTNIEAARANYQELYAEKTAPYLRLLRAAELQAAQRVEELRLQKVVDPKAVSTTKDILGLIGSSIPALAVSAPVPTPPAPAKPEVSVEAQFALCEIQSLSRSGRKYRPM